MITDSQIESGQLKAELKEKVVYTLLRKHRHQTKKSNLRSLADIGKTVSSASRLFSNTENGNLQLYSLCTFSFCFSNFLFVSSLTTTSVLIFLLTQPFACLFISCSFFSVSTPFPLVVFAVSDFLRRGVLQHATPSSLLCLV